MKNWILTSLLLFGWMIIWAQNQETHYQEYSYAELYRMISEEIGQEFILKNAIIKANQNTDSLFLTPLALAPQRDTIFRLRVTKQLLFNNVIFDSTNPVIEEPYYYSFFNHIEFMLDVTLININSVNIINCKFNNGLTISPGLDKNVSGYSIINSIFNNSVDIKIGQPKTKFYLGSGLSDVHSYANSINTGMLRFSNNQLSSKTINPVFGSGDYPRILTIASEGLENLEITNNTLLSKGTIEIISSNGEGTLIVNNDFKRSISFLTIGELQGVNQLRIKQNIFGDFVYLNLRDLRNEHYVEWDQFNNKIVALGGNTKSAGYQGPEKYEIFKKYVDSIRIHDSEAYDAEIALRSQLHTHYKSKLAFKGANGVYVEIKDLETERFASIYSGNPNFENYITLKINQFLKLFSEYGTRPVKSILFSIYVIFLFALIYIIFPNSWDKDGRQRLVDRYSFFFRYLLREDGLHEVYLEGKKESLNYFDEFKALIDKSNRKVPKFFIFSALKIYKWGISSTNLAASMLKKFDIIEGRWEDLPSTKKVRNSIFITGAFIVAIIYDLTVKILNALMLSVNAFTTLGFGEIPIKGLPRYLAIIEGFIGWFMLTIFSVSLISQLLN